MDDFSMPGNVTFSADEEKAMRDEMRRHNHSADSPQPQMQLTPKVRALMEGTNLLGGKDLPDDATDRQ
jgi:hypothetical protein